MTFTFKGIKDQSNNGIIVVEVGNSIKVKSVTMGFYKAMGYNSNDRAKDIFDLVYSEDRDILKEAFKYAADNIIANDCIFRAGRDGGLLEHMCFFRYTLKKNNNAVVIGAITNITNISHTSGLNSLTDIINSFDKGNLSYSGNLSSMDSLVVRDIFGVNKKNNILIITGEKSSRETFDDVLGNEYGLDYTDNNSSAIEAMRKKNYSMVICDIYQPETACLEFLKIVHADIKLSSVPVILLVESKDYDTEVKALKLGAIDILQRSYISEILKIRVKNLIGIRENAKLSEQNFLYEMQLCQQSRLLWLAEHDELTGLLNRQAFYRRIRSRIDKDPEKKYMVIRFDIDKFSVFNDTMGVKAGDKLLKDIADVMRRICVYDDMIYARIEADHFAIFADTANMTPDFVFDAIEKQFKDIVTDYNVYLHMGVYIVDDYSIEPSIMCDRALMVLKSLKGSYTNRIAYYDDSIRSRLLREQELVADMVDALKNNEFEVYFQPQYNYMTHKLLGAEALVRWNHPKHGMMSPDSFIPLFEKNGFISKLDEYVWETVCKCISIRIKENGCNIAPVSVNVSRIDINHNNLCETLCAITEKYDVPHHLLHLEITESSFMKNPQRLIKVVEKLKQSGFTIEMDDFGSSYSSLNILKDVPVDVLKLDMKFLSDTNNTARSGNILSSVIRMARWLTMPVIAEGVETKEQADYLKSIGCIYMQGYYFAKPMPLHQYVKLFEINNIGGLDKYKSVNIETAEKFWDASAQTALIFNSFVGGAAIIEKDGNNIEMLRANDMFFDVIRTKRDLYMPHIISFTDLLNAEEQKRFNEMLKIASQERKEASCEIHFKAISSGEPVWTINRARLLAHNINSDIFYISVNNITERKQKEIELLEKIKLNDKMQNILPYGIVEYLVKDNDVHIVYCNDTSWKLMGFENKQEFISSVAQNGLSSNSKGLFNISNDKMKKALDNSEIIDFESNVRSADGYVHRFRVYMQVSPNKPNGFYLRSSFIDINDIIHNIPIGFAIYQQKEKMYPIFIDKKVCEMFKIDDIDEGYLPDFNSIPKDLMDEMNSGKTVTVPRLHVKRKDGTGFWIRMVCTLVKKENAYPLCYTTMFDVTDEIEKEQNAILQENRYKLLVESTDTITFDYSVDKDIMTISFATPGKNRTQVHYNDYLKYLPSKQSHVADEFKEKIKNSIVNSINRHTENHEGTIDYKADYFNGGLRWYRAKFIRLPDAEGNIKNIIGRVEDVDDIMTSQIDMVTGLINKDAARIAIENIIKKKPVDRFDAMLFIDIDNFKSVNDTIGHLGADKVLKKIGDILKNTFRRNDIVARYGGDEFLIYMVSAGDMDKTEEKAMQIIKNVGAIQTKVPNGVHCSVGITEVKGEMKNFEALFNRTDYALYASKHDGKDRYTVSSNNEIRIDSDLFLS